MKFNITAAIRTDQQDAAGLCAIYINMYEVNKSRARVTLGENIPKDDFDPVSRPVKKSVHCAILLLRLIAKKIRDLEKSILTATLKGPAFPLTRNIENDHSIQGLP
jgi:hypothetical protein